MLELMREENAMRTTVTLDDELLKKAQGYTGIAEKSVLVNAALTALVQREAARRLARMGGTAPALKAPPRRRPPLAARRRRTNAA
jgi:Arc/MetJ family transcription regulator